MCHMYARYNECLFTPAIILFPGLVLRSYHRAKHRITGSLFRDWAHECCCPLCAACQLDRDMKHMEKMNGTLHI
ncbi:Placenta-specificprotein 8 protein [Fasciola gigantica]|uniref:Placenta-specificprotein 8 protein n=1 Tax=Fasciola gigantica TaxID=46835 RepID=A0A504YP47_FASGI|nr:Placenta-specificprotein 8 protein [Fasciola gigantica]